MKLPLDVELTPDMLEPSARLHQAVDGSGESSLLRYLLTAHLAGFRLFESVAKANAWRQRDAFGIEAFRSALAEALGQPLPGLDPQQIDLFLRSPARKRGAFEPPVLSDRLAVRLAVSERAGPPPPLLRAVCDRIAAALCRGFPDWGAMYADPAQAKRLIDEGLAEIAPGLPTVQVTLPTDPGLDAPIGFDPALALQGPWPEDDATALRIVLARGVREARLQGRDPAAGGAISIAQDYLLTRSENALSWLFNRGWLFLRDADPSDLAVRVGAPASALEGLGRLVEAARALPAVPPLLTARDYASFRRRFGWRLRTWASQDLRRFVSLGERVEEERRRVPAPQDTAAGEDAEWKAALLARHRLLADVERLCHRFLGGERQDPTVHDAAALQGTLTALDALDDALRHQAERRSRERPSGHRTGPSRNPATPVAAAEAARWPSFPGLPGQVGSPDQAARQLSERIDSLFRLQAAMLEEAVAGARGGHLAWLRTREKLESRRLPSGTPLASVRGQAVRRALQQLLELARVLPEPLRIALQASFREEGVITDARLLNRLFVNRHGSLFLPYRSMARHRPVRIDEAAAIGVDWLAHLARLEAHAARRVGEAGAGRDLEALIAVRGLRLQWQLDAGSEEFDPASHTLRQLAAASAMPPLLQAGLTGLPGRASASRAAWREAGRWISDELLAVLPEATQPAWQLRHSFSRMRSTALLYVPKERPWLAPSRYLAAPGPIGEAARQGLLGPLDGPAAETAVGLASRAAADRHGIGHALATADTERAGAARAPASPGSCLARVLARPQIDLPAASALRQIPHDWYLAVGLASTQGRARAGLPLDGCPLGLVGLAVESRAGVARLMGPGTRKAQLDRMLIDRGLSLGDATLILEWRFRQSFRVDVVRSRFVLERELVSGRASAALPISDAGLGTAAVRLVDRLLAIDLGSQGFSWAAFDIRGHFRRATSPGAAVAVPGLIATGTERVLSMRALSQAVARAGALSSPRARRGAQQRIERLQAHAVADTCQRIEQLCERFEAFPVLESLRAAFESGATPLTVAYAAVVRRYAYSPIASHTRQRNEHWFGADQWTHPYLRTVPGDGAQGRVVTGRRQPVRLRPLHLFPGTAVDPTGTSQRCPCCERNPIERLRALGAAAALTSAGEIPVDDGTLRLDRPGERGAPETPPPVRRKAAYASNGESLTQSQLIALAKTSLRRPSALHQGRNRYRCLYTDCGASGDADEFAAINVGRKFLVERVRLAAEVREAALGAPSGKQGTLRQKKSTMHVDLRPTEV